MLLLEDIYAAIKQKSSHLIQPFKKVYPSTRLKKHTHLEIIKIIKILEKFKHKGTIGSSTRDKRCF